MCGNMKFLFIGFGSIGKRHIRNLQSIFRSKGMDLKIDLLRHSNEYADMPDEFEINNVYYSFSRLDMFYDAVFITNPTELHLVTINNVLQYSNNFFIEKPVVSYNQIEALNNTKFKDGDVYYVACPLRYSRVIQFLKHNINAADIVAVRSISSSYLPDWRPGVDYRNTYSARKELGGGVSIDLIHEWDYLTYLYGMPLEIKSMIGRKSLLEINSDDYAVYMADYGNKIVELHLDYFGRVPIRESVIFTKDDTIVADLQHGKIKCLKENRVVVFTEERNDYQIRELEHFLDIVAGRCANDSTIGHAVDVLKLTQGVVV